MGGQIVGIDDLDALIRIAGLRVVVLLIVGKAKFAQGILGAGILHQDSFKVGDGFFDLAGIALDNSAIVKGARISGQ